ncbi:MAG: hydrogenase formation protein HypD [Calditrichaeota bacterium]|nr:MAG: hydrogenase formation protein HypD [Calditrichota bacterium]
MKYIDEYRDARIARMLVEKIRDVVQEPWAIMEICGGQTHTILKYGLEELLPTNLTLLHGPGCPVCVTPLESIDRAIALAEMPDLILTSFGDMLRVPGSKDDLQSVKARGGDVRYVYSPLDAVALAERQPDKKVVFFAVGFETTAPANAMAVQAARKKGLKNFFLLTSQVRVPPAMELLLSSADHRIDAFLAAGHVCTIMGYHEYEPIAERHRVPIVVTGFEPIDILQGIFTAVEALQQQRYIIDNQYTRAVVRQGNLRAQKLLEEVFTIVDKKWRGIGVIPQSGLHLNDDYAEFDAERAFAVVQTTAQESSHCMAGLVLQGRVSPLQCSAFGRECTPEHPLGAPMVSSEGACAAYFRYGDHSESSD